MPQSLLPGQNVPELKLDTVDGTGFDISIDTADFMTLVEVYRGLHCPRCHRHLLALSGLLPRFNERGVNVIAISTDTRDRAEQAQQSWGLGSMRLGYGLDPNIARSWGIYLSKPITDREPQPFAEPATFWIRPDGTLYAATYGTTPFSRPHWPDWLEALDTIRTRNYPPRGDLE
ncbi:redoxin domain-containing protein [uncultured Ruegeria sp.]|uniref:redoxin domain-containing protein n=1 Tax=uncultured Ruegeria sp. TaxID=259304 RepID=UPI002603D35D|nr:redoxin domain-containing protein [uncultured Ruegeria sp.]